VIRQIDAMDWADWAGEWFASVFRFLWRRGADETDAGQTPDDADDLSAILRSGVRAATYS